MMMSDDKVGGWVKKGQNHDDVILECALGEMYGCQRGIVEIHQNSTYPCNPQMQWTTIGPLHRPPCPV